jgi:mono/diheme cytochrome c family protein
MRFLAVIGSLAIIVGIAAGAYFLGGFYSVAASNEDPGPVVSALTWVRNASIARHAEDRPQVALDDIGAIRDGARHFAQYGCSHCHGAPGVEWSKFSEGLNPGAADLAEIAKVREAAAIFWVVKHGIRMTGMPSFGKAGVPDNELWQIAAFVKKLPSVSEADYKGWTAPPAQR